MSYSPSSPTRIEGSAPSQAAAAPGEDPHSLSLSSDEAASDWSSPSDTSDLEEDAEGLENEIDPDEEEFDLLASQELRQLPSDSTSSSQSTSSSHARTRNPTVRRMTLSFPDPIATSAWADSDVDVTASRPAPPRSPAASLTSHSDVSADCKELDNSILVDGGAYSLMLDAADMTSTPPPADAALPASVSSPRAGFLRSSPSSSTIIRSKAPKKSDLDPEDKVGRWRSTLTTPSDAAPPLSTGPTASIESSQTDFSSVHSSQTVVPALTSASSSISVPSPVRSRRASSCSKVEFDKSLEVASGSEKSSSMTLQLDRIAKAADQDRRVRSASPVLGLMSKLMLGLTLTGIALAGIATIQQVRYDVALGPLDLVRNLLRVSTRLPLQHGDEPVLDRHEERDLEFEVQVPATVPTAVEPSTSVLQHHTLPTATPPVSLAFVSRPRLPAPPKVTPVYSIDPPLDPEADADAEADARLERNVLYGVAGHKRLKERMWEHAARCGALERRIEAQLVHRTAGYHRKNLRRDRRHRRKTVVPQVQEQVILGVDSQFGRSVAMVENEPEQDYRAQPVDDAKDVLNDIWTFFEGLERKVRHEIKQVVQEHVVRDSKRSEERFAVLSGLSVRLARYPIVRDYCRARVEASTKELRHARKEIKAAWKEIGTRIGRASKHEGLRVRATVQDVYGSIKSRVNFGTKLVHDRVVGSDRVRKSMDAVASKGEKHIRRAAKAVRKIERQDRLSEISSVSPGDKYIGLALAISSSIAIGTSFIITKKGLISAADQSDGFSSDSYSYLKNGLWWAGMLTMVVGEVANFAAYTFAPPVLVTPLGALSVLIGAVLAAFFLGERLGPIGISGCSLCLVGSLIIVLHAPEDKEIATVDEILDYALQPGFMFYCLVVLCYSLYAIYRIAPKHGTSNPLVYISICSLVGSVSVMAVKGFGVALKLTFAGNNQLWRAGTWIFAVTVVGCIAVQMNYFNKALDLFPTTVVNPSYFVGFSSCTLLASIILFHGLNTTGGANTLSLLCGLFVICLGVYLLNLSRSENESSNHHRRLSHPRRSLLDGGGGGLMRTSQSNGGAGGGRLSMASDTDDPTGRRSTNMYRSGGLISGGVPAEAPLFDYHGGEDLHMDKFTLREDSDEEGYSSGGGERRALRGHR
ncbi:uncharacterized protein JCM15063_004446 [Sporobolomyces koalae]|uniref:uncharacterized protein n=1 Tax=Sporobolomyces koalae TaxID=500713 RepID=UPI00317A7456